MILELDFKSVDEAMDEDYLYDGIGYNRIDPRSFYGKCCSYCKAAIDAWRFLPDFIKEIV